MTDVVVPAWCRLAFDPCLPGEAAVAAWLGERVGAVDAELSSAAGEKLSAHLKARLVVGHAALQCAWAAEGAAEREAAARREVTALAEGLAQARLAVAMDGREAAEAWAEERLAETERYTRERVEAAERIARDRVEAAERAAREERVRSDSLTQRLEALAAASGTAEVQRLEALLDAERAKAAGMANSNHAKGATGEAAVMTTLRAAFPDWAFEDTSGRAAHSDFHMTSPCGGRVIAVEVLHAEHQISIALRQLQLNHAMPCQLNHATATATATESIHACICLSSCPVFVLLVLARPRR